MWSPDGNELFYTGGLTDVGPGGPRLMGVEVATEPRFAFRGERVLPIQGFQLFSNYRDYDVAPDGQFLMVFLAGQAGSGEPARTQIDIVLNWFEVLKEQVPLP